MARGPTLARRIERVLRYVPKRARVPIVYKLATYSWEGETTCRIAPSVDLVVDLNDWVQRVYFFGDRESFKIDLMRSLLPADGTYVDVGANVGFHACVMAGHAQRGRVITYEPMAENLERLRINVAVNLFQHVEINPIGLSDADATLVVSVPGTHQGGSSAGARVGEPPEGWMTMGTAEVRRLDDVLDVHRLDLLKIDIEGHEVRMLNGARVVAARHRPYIVCEVAQENQADVAAWAKDLRYTIEQIGQRGVKPGFVAVTGDVLMTPAERSGP